MNDLELLEIQMASGLVLDGADRIVARNDPEKSAGPRFVLAGCETGNAYRFHRDVPEDAVREIGRLIVSEPPLESIDAVPLHGDAYRKILGGGETSSGLIYRLPHHVPFSAVGPVVRSDSPEGEALISGVRRNGVPAALFAMGFLGEQDFWPPWCAVLGAGEEIAALAFTARLGERGADIGVVTVPAFRKHGFAATATAAWAGLHEMEPRELFYSTSHANRSSQGVAARLGLKLLGSTFTVGNY